MTSPFPKENPESICIIRLSAIGDCCHTLPVVRTRSVKPFPIHLITWIIGKTEHSLLEGADGIEFITFDKSRGWRGIMDVRRQLKGRHFPVLLHMHASMRANMISATLNARAAHRVSIKRAHGTISGFFRPRRIPATAEQHVMERLCSSLQNIWAYRDQGAALGYSCF